MFTINSVSHAITHHHVNYCDTLMLLTSTNCDTLKCCLVVILLSHLQTRFRYTVFMFLFLFIAACIDITTVCQSHLQLRCQRTGVSCFVEMRHQWMIHHDNCGVAAVFSLSTPPGRFILSRCYHQDGLTSKNGIHAD